MSLEELDLTPGQFLLFLFAACLTVVSLGHRMSGYTNRTVGFVLMCAGVAGMVGTILWWQWPLSWRRALLLVAGVLVFWLLTRLLYRKDRARIEEVAAQLASRCLRLTGLYQLSGRSVERAQDLLIPWKVECLEYLDANIGPEIAAEFHGLSTGRQTGQPYQHLDSSYEIHLSFLERLRKRVQRGVARVKAEDEPSGTAPRTVKSFIYGTQAG